MNENYFDRRIKEIVGGGEFKGVSVEEGRRGGFLARFPDAPTESIKELKKDLVADRYTVKFHYSKKGKMQFFPVSVKIFKQTERHKHRLPPGISLDAYVEFVYGALDDMGCDMFFDKFYDRFPEERAIVSEYIDWPTAFEVAMPISEGIHKKYGMPSDIIIIPEIERGGEELQLILASIINNLAFFHVLASLNMHNVKPKKNLVYNGKKLEERETYFFKENGSHMSESSLIYLKQILGEERFKKMSEEDKQVFIEGMNVLHSGMRDRDELIPIHGDFNSTNIAIRKNKYGDYDVKFLDCEHMKIWNRVCDLSNLLIDLPFHILPKGNSPQFLMLYGEYYLKRFRFYWEREEQESK